MHRRIPSLRTRLADRLESLGTTITALAAGICVACGRRHGALPNWSSRRVAVLVLTGATCAVLLSALILARADAQPPARRVGGAALLCCDTCGRMGRRLPGEVNSDRCPHCAGFTAHPLPPASAANVVWVGD